MLGTLALALLGPRRAAYATLVFAVAFVLFNGPIEGPVLVTLSATHGVTASDLVAAASVLAAVLVLIRRRR